MHNETITEAVERVHAWDAQAHREQILWAIEAWEAHAALVDEENPHGAYLARRTAESLRMELADGIARCVCCLQPYGGGRIGSAHTHDAGR